MLLSVTYKRAEEEQMSVVNSMDLMLYLFPPFSLLGEELCLSYPLPGTALSEALITLCHGDGSAGSFLVANLYLY